MKNMKIDSTFDQVEFDKKRRTIVHILNILGIDIMNYDPDHDLSHLNQEQVKKLIELWRDAQIWEIEHSL